MYQRLYLKTRYPESDRSERQESKFQSWVEKNNLTNNAWNFLKFKFIKSNIFVSYPIDRIVRNEQISAGMLYLSENIYFIVEERMKLNIFYSLISWVLTDYKRLSFFIWDIQAAISLWSNKISSSLWFTLIYFRLRCE